METQKKDPSNSDLENEKNKPTDEDLINDVLKDEEEDENVLSDEEADKIALDRLNKATGKDYKSLEDYKEKEKKVDKFFADKGKQKKKEEILPNPPVKPETSPVGQVRNHAEDVLTLKYPDAATVLDEVKEEANRTRKDVVDVYEGSTHLQNEAKARSEVNREEKVSNGKVGSPTPFIVGKTLSYEKVDLQNPDHIKWLKAKPERITAYNDWLKLNYKKVK